MLTVIVINQNECDAYIGDVTVAGGHNPTGQTKVRAGRTLYDRRRRADR